MPLRVGFINERGSKQSLQREKLPQPMSGDQAQLPGSSLLESQGCADPPAMSCDNTREVLSTMDTHRRLGAQGFHWELPQAHPLPDMNR